MKWNWLLVLLLLAGWSVAPALAQEEEDDEEEVATQDDSAATDDEDEDDEDDEEEGGMRSSTFSGLKLRGLGPALTSGRVGDLAVDPDSPKTYYVAISSGGVWKTVNGGTTFKPVFDGEGSYSIGCVAMDPTNHNVVWVGTGENNSQRSVSFGDGVYVTRNGGKSWKNVGLGESEHIGMIAIDPRDPDVVFVAAQGPLWASGGERGLYKTTNGGADWERVLHVDDDTGINEVHLDPRDPDVLYASAYQRRRRTWTLIDGGPGSGIHKSTDGGVTWRKLKSGLPSGDKGRIGLDISPANPDVVYSIIEATGDKGGVFRSTDRGETWSKRSSYMTSSPQYYNEIICDPVDVDRLYALDTLLQRSNDGGASFSSVPRENRHVDDHALWIDPADTDHMMVGCDGGLYETWDAGANWQYRPNLPVTQFYRVAVDDSTPFYYVYGGTQDNATLGGPSRTVNRAGIPSEDWFVTVGGDGFETQVDPEDPNIVYSQWQYGGLVRHDRRSGEIVDIKPRELPDDEPYRWNWDAPLLISPHEPHRLYFGANRLFRSDDRGDSWRAISGDLTRQIDRNELEVMGRIQPDDAVAKHMSTSMYGNLVALSESPLVEGLIYVGTDDGLIQVTEDGGETWRKVEGFLDVPERSYVSAIIASRHDANGVFASFDNHKNGDFAPYLLKSTDRGRTWTSITRDLPERNIVYTIGEDHVDADLLFAGTEFGVFFTVDGGERWVQLESGIPTIAVRDLELQRRENDLVLATFGRGFYVLDDYSPLRAVDDAMLEQDAFVFDVKDAWQYIQTGRLGGGRGSQGATYYTADNPPFGAVFTYYLKEKILNLEEQRSKAAKEAKKNDEPVPYPTIEELRAEERAVDPRVLLTVRDDDGEVVRRLTGSRSRGVHRTSWDLRWPASTPVSLGGRGGRRGFGGGGAGPMVVPGTYTVTLEKEVDGAITQLTEPQSFEVVPLDLATLAADDRGEVMAFQRKTARLQRAVQGAMRVANDAEERLQYARRAFMETPDLDPAILADIDALTVQLDDLLIQLRGDRVKSSRMEPTPPSISTRVRTSTGSWRTTSPPTQTQRDAYRYAGEAFTEVLAALRTLVEDDLAGIEERLEDAGAPWTPGRFPRWEIE